MSAPPTTGLPPFDLPAITVGAGKRRPQGRRLDVPGRSREPSLLFLRSASERIMYGDLPGRGSHAHAIRHGDHNREAAAST
jgi:hypothetical protein